MLTTGRYTPTKTIGNIYSHQKYISEITANMALLEEKLKISFIHSQNIFV